MRIEKLLLWCVLLMLIGCVNSPTTSQSNKSVSVPQLEGMPLPSGATIDSKNSIIFGEGPSWTGRVEITASLKAEDMVKFFISEYPSAGWKLLSSTKSKSSILIFVGSNRTMNAEINELSGFNSGSKIILTVAPMNTRAK